MDGSGIFAHHNGVWFQGRTLVTPAVTWDIFSFSVDVWLKHYDTRSGNLIETTAGAPRSWRFGFNPPNLFFTLNGFTQNYVVAFDAPRMYNKWYIAQASVARVALLESKIWVKWNDDPISWGFHATIYDDNNPEATIVMMIGSGFSGYMRKIKIYDYPKQNPSFELMYKQEPQCYKFHHTQSDCEICDIDYNFTCYTE